MEIKINVTDVKSFASAAFVLDQDETFNKILEIRHYWKLSKAFIPYAKFDIWYGKHKDDFALTPDVKNYWGVFPNFSFTQTEPIASPEIINEVIYSNPIDLELEHLQRKYGIPPQLKNFMLKAIVCNEIRERDWGDINKDGNFSHYDNFFNIPIYKKLYGGDTKPEIKRDRMWYWECKGGKTPLQISKEVSKKKAWISAEEYRKSVDNAVRRYEEFLKSKGTFINKI